MHNDLLTDDVSESTSGSFFRNCRILNQVSQKSVIRKISFILSSNFN